MKCINCGQNFIRNYNREDDSNGEKITICPHCGHKEIYKMKYNDKEKKIKLNEIRYL